MLYALAVSKNSEPRHRAGLFCICTTGKSVGCGGLLMVCFLAGYRGTINDFSVSALSVVVNVQTDAHAYQLDGEVMALPWRRRAVNTSSKPEISAGHHTPIPASWETRPQSQHALPSCPPRRGLFIQAADNHPQKPRSYRVGRPFPTTNTAPRQFRR